MSLENNTIKIEFENDTKKSKRGSNGAVLELIYTSYDGTISNNVDELKESNLFFYQCLICHRHLLKDIEDDEKDIKHILKTILESNSTYFVIGTDIEDMDSTEVFGKLDLVKLLKKNTFSYGIAYIDYDDQLLSLDIKFNAPVCEFNNSKNIDLFMSYDDLAKIIPGINLDKTMQENWSKIQHWWHQKELFKNLD